MHVAAILARQDFLLKLTRALMMFGASPMTTARALKRPPPSNRVTFLHLQARPRTGSRHRCRRLLASSRSIARWSTSPVSCSSRLAIPRLTRVRQRCAIQLLAGHPSPTSLTHRLSQFLKQANGLDLGKLLSTHMVYWNVSRRARWPPKLSATDVSAWAASAIGCAR
jgi:hypothetical protein